MSQARARARGLRYFEKFLKSPDERCGLSFFEMPKCQDFLSRNIMRNLRITRIILCKVKLKRWQLLYLKRWRSTYLTLYLILLWKTTETVKTTSLAYLLQLISAGSSFVIDNILCVCQLLGLKTPVLKTLKPLQLKPVYCITVPTIKLDFYDILPPQ